MILYIVEFIYANMSINTRYYIYIMGLCKAACEPVSSANGKDKTQTEQIQSDPIPFTRISILLGALELGPLKCGSDPLHFGPARC